MPLIQTVAPSEEPVSLVDAKNHLRVDTDLTQDDVLIKLLIGAARRYAEMYCNRSFITQQWRLVLDSFPGNAMYGVPFGITFSLPGNAILIERGPVQSLDSIIYTAMDGAEVTMPAADWIAELSGGLARVTPRFGKIWPIPLPQIGAVKVNFTAGYGAMASDVPEGIRQWILLRVSSLYENREEVAVMQRGNVSPLPYVDGLLDPYRVVTA
jgi:uncharacterized phiE125 gp8 family phage protein